jgi:hypothetical protein
MSEIDIEALKAGIFASLEGDEMAGLDLDDLASAMSHPLANEVVRELMPLEASSVQQGEPCRDFELPFLPGQGGQEGETLRLTDRTKDRPVALIFGSYT